ncbi:hypothetical protein KAH81_00920 [bacterium]|nr:hypothetical protein [bacterium]
MRILLVILFLALSVNAQVFNNPDRFWLSAKWLDNGEILLTEGSYRGLFIYRNDGSLDTITLDWKAGYRPQISNGFIAYTAYENFDGEGNVFVYDSHKKKNRSIYGDFNLGPPSFNKNGDLVFSDGQKIYTFSIHSELIEVFQGGAYLVVPIEGGFLWCDRAGVAWSMDTINQQTQQIELGDESKFLFSPVVSKDGKFVLLEDISGVVFLYDVLSRISIKLPYGDKPFFTEKPSGIIQLQLKDDGEEIIQSNIIFVGIEDTTISQAIEIAAEYSEYIITDIDYNPKHGLLLTTSDGQFILDRDCIKEINK